VRTPQPFGKSLSALPGSCRGNLRRAWAASVSLLALLAGCAQVAGDPGERIAVSADDPLEPVNRGVFVVNQVLDRLLFKPVAQSYDGILPEDGRNAIRRILDNLKEPVVVLNDTLQGEFERAGISVGRFGVNTTLGLAGSFDLAAKWGLDRQIGDFGQTLFVWGLPSGPYLMLPVLGPSNPRDGLGMLVDSYIDPLTFLANAKGLQEVEIGRFVADGVDQRARVVDVLDELEKNSLDFYAELRSLTQQKRAAELRRGQVETPKNFYNDPSPPQAK
jgi:phospholipid-binding lipoprotein MlaA